MRRVRGWDGNLPKENEGKKNKPTDDKNPKKLTTGRMTKCNQTGSKAPTEDLSGIEGR